MQGDQYFLMKTDKYKPRSYRDWIAADDLFKTSACVKETDVVILSDKPVDEDYAVTRIKFYRSQIENYISRDNRFFTSLKPISVELTAPAIIKKMAQAAKTAGVGPMAAVAGAIAECLGRDLLKRGAKNIIIENGGDVFLKISRPIKAAIYTGKSKFWKNLFIKVSANRNSFGMCASSGTTGHSLNFGRADNAVVIAKNAFLADAVATAIANRVQDKKSLNAALEFAGSLKGVSAAIIIFQKNLASFGKGFEFVK